MRRSLICCFVGLCLASSLDIATPKSQAAFLQVGPGQTYTTLLDGYNAASNGDTLRLHDGIYSGGLHVAKELRFEAVNVGKAIVDGGGVGLDDAVFFVAADAAFSGLLLRNSTHGLYERDTGAHIAADHLIIANCDVALGINNSAGNSGSIDALNLSIYSCGTGVDINDGGTINLTNTIIANTANGYIAVNAIAINPNHNLLFEVPNMSGGSGIAADPAQLVGDPLFANAATFDFRLLPGSPAIDSGTDVGLPFSGPAPDLGAIETPEPTSIVLGVIGGVLGLIIAFHSQKHRMNNEHTIEHA